ncbi:hypothetical protein [Legionella erythra]|uniref:Uncharacterized protein n=1 Tax=Legionella erythra TaxID=448 RepID=A0A0W0TLS8_LEGER|nr:hypothetical protein [Legionella erythra]KTC96559.1 hypothetical protein Lery_1765 [Legionella erythra]
MSNGFNYRITLSSSRHYLYTLALLNTTASLLLVYSGLPWALIIPLLGVLLGIFLCGIRHPYPAGGCREFIHQGNTWQLVGHDAIETFTKHRLLLHTGLFILVKFFSEDKQKVLVIFCDQLGKDDDRQLKIIEKVK